MSCKEAMLQIENERGRSQINLSAARLAVFKFTDQERTSFVQTLVAATFEDASRIQIMKVRLV